MKKFLFLICLFTISFNIVSSSGNDAKEFMNGFFQAIKGNDWKLKDECFDDKFKSELSELIENIKNNNFLKSVEIFTQMKLEATANCPVEEIIEIQKLLAAQIKSGEIISSIKNNFNQIFKIVLELLDSQTQRTPYGYGKALGSIALIVLYNKQHNLRSLSFLAEPVKQVKIQDDDWEKFFKGFLSGVSSVPFEQNQCYKDVDGFLDEIKASALKVYSAVLNKSPKEFTDALKELSAVLLKIKAYDNNCNVTQLIKSITVYTTTGYAGLAKLIYNITSNGVTYFELTKEMTKSIKDSNFENAGKVSGKIVKTLMSWETK